MKIIKFNISGDFAFFKDKSNTRSNSSYVSIHKPSILGMLGAILGLDGFSDFKKNGTIKYLNELSEINIGIKINNPIDFVEVKTNDSTSLNITNIQNRVTQQVENILVDVSYDIFLEINNSELYNRIFNSLKNKEYVFDPKMGKSYFPATITFVKEIEINKKESFSVKMDSENISFYIESIYPSSFTDIEVSDFKNEEFFNEIGLLYRLPVKSDLKTGSYIQNNEFTFKNFVPKESILLENNFKVVDNELIYFI